MEKSLLSPELFAEQILKFYDLYGRKDLPWQQDKTAYRVWVSEIMLQQTQVKTVIPYYNKFIQSFPTVKHLADADIDQVLQLWQGLGYYSRARNLYACAKQVVNQYQGKFPDTLPSIVELPGIGESTGGAILSLAYGQPEAILDGNVKRVLSRCFMVDGWYGQAKVGKELWKLSRKYTPKTRTDDFNQAMMDLGSSLCSRNKPTCEECPLEDLCLANLKGKTAEYPHRKPKKDIPTKTATMLLRTNNQQQVQLVKRPPSGIWGGLWSLPELDIDPNEHLASLIGQFKHTFSHYHLRASVVESRNLTAEQNTVQDNPNLAWHNISQLANIALPTPIKKYLFKHFQIKEN